MSELGAARQDLNMLHNINSPTVVKGNVGKTKSSLSDYFPPKGSEHRKNLSKSTQVNSTDFTQDISIDVPSEHFWKKVAENRRVALDEALGENDRLRKLYELVKIQNNTYKYMLKGVKNFVDVVKDVILKNADVTGIVVEDLNDSAGSANANI